MSVRKHLEFPPKVILYLHYGVTQKRYATCMDPYRENNRAAVSLSKLKSKRFAYSRFLSRTSSNLPMED
jgi:hypothetical protein